ncbi:TetR/AcrR family transcriptional regulator [uncultured Aquabacterium sp.]|uniref:TetR/AcrR family transcriptional regulator n=1 Tax=uncultured Aquabacterium sp. TaxID=158753 RepID=UPI0026173076|nr:TetR/AcrR family transcriptional regulator [uncultured Aquabacterium sp.]
MSRPRSIDRDSVLDVAESIVVARGVSELTFDAVAKGAGITKGGVQSCFGTKEGLIAAMLDRWNLAYEAEKASLDSQAGHEELTPTERHVRVTATAHSLNTRSASLLAALLQSREQVAGIRAWYAAQFAQIDATTDDGRRARLAFLATEGAFMLRYLGLADIGDVTWREIFQDIERCAAPQRNTPARQGS